MNLAKFALHNRVFVLFMVIISVIGGVASYFELGKLEDPTFTIKTALVGVLYPGASASEIEEQVTDVVETKLQEMGQLWKLRSLSIPGASFVFVDLKESTNTKALPQQWDLLRRKVNDLSFSLPPEAQIRLVQDEFSEVFGMLFNIHSQDASPNELRNYAKELQRRLKTIDGIKKIELHGVQNRAIYIDMPEERLAQYNLSAAQVWTQLSAQSATFYAGRFSADQERVRVNQSSEFQSVEDVKSLLIKSGVSNLGTSVLKLGDIANVTLAYQDPPMTLNRFNGEAGVTVAVSPIPGINVVALGDALNQVINDYRAELPLGVTISTIAFQPDEVDKAINNFLINLLESVVIVMAVLWIFMGLRSASIIGGSLLLTVLLTLIFMFFYGIDLQRVSLGAFIIALGMLVDNAIVVTDMFITKLKQTGYRTQAATEAVKETALPLFGATIIAIMGASPVLFSKLNAAEFALSVFQVMASSLLFSWLVAVTVTPLCCWYFIKEVPDEEENKESRYQRLIRYTVTNPWKVVMAAVPAIAITALLIPMLQFNFMPSSDRPVMFLDYWLPNGAQIEQTSKDIEAIEAWLLTQPEVTNITTFVGESAPRFSVTIEPEPLDSAYGQILVNLTDFDTAQDLVTRGDAWLAEQFPNAEPRFRYLKLATQDKYSLETRFSGPDPQVLHQLAAQAKAVFAQNQNIKYIRDDWRQESKVLTPIINQERARNAGVSRADIAFTLARASTGIPLGQMYIDDEDIPILLRGDNRSLESLETLPVRSLLGLHSVPLGQVIDGVQMEFEPSMIWRRNRQKCITVQAGVRNKTASDLRKEIAKQIEAIELPPGYSFEWGGEYYDEQRTVYNILIQLPKALFIMVIIMVAMFNGLKQPAIILTTLPLAASGIVASLLIFNFPFGFIALIGTITLTGMIIKNGIVLIDQIELERKQGVALDTAIVKATKNRTLAITMGALTTALGMIPLLSDRLFAPMAATIIGGLCAATAMSLIFMPALYHLAYSHSKKAERHNEPSTPTQASGAPHEI